MTPSTDPLVPPVRRMEEIMMAAWPDFQMTLRDGWVVRYGGGISKRANSVWPLYPGEPASPADLGPRIEWCEEFYRGVGQSVVFKLTERSTPAELDSELEKRGYEIADPTKVQVRSLSDPIGPGHPKAVIEDRFTEEWFEAFNAGHPSSNAASESTMRKLFARIRTPVRTVRCCDGPTPLGCGYAVIDSVMTGLYAIWVEPTARRSGIGRGVTNALLAASREAGARAAYLQVVSANEPAVRLYEQCGFVDYYGYWYRVLR